MIHRCLPPAIRRWRWFVIGLAIALMLWLPVEDVHVESVILLAASMCSLAAVRVSMRLPRPSWPIIGSLGGLCVSAVSLLLMAFKSGLHGHGQPDFTPEQVLEVIQRTPIFFITGLLISSGITLIYLGRKNSQPPHS